MREHHKELVQHSTTDNNQEPPTATHNNPKKGETNDTDLKTWNWYLQSGTTSKHENCPQKVEITKKLLKTTWNISNTSLKNAIYKTMNAILATV